MTTIRTLKIIKGVLAASVAATGILAILLGTHAVAGRQGDGPQDFYMDIAQGCEDVYGNYREECVAAWCTWWGNTSSLMERQCFHPDGGYCD